MKLPVGILAGACFSVVFAVLWACLLGRLSPPIAWFALGLGLLFPAYAQYLDLRKDPLRKPSRLTIWDVLAIVAFSLFALRSFLWVVYSVGNELRIVNPNNLGDLPLHWQYTMFLAEGAKFWPANPIVAHGSIGYPFGVDLLNSLLVLTGLDVARSFVWVGLVGSAVTLAMLFRWGRAFVVAGFLFNGGFAGIAMLQDWSQRAFQTVDWKSIALALFVTQRGFLYAFPVGLLLLDSWRTRIQRANGLATTRAPLPFWAEVAFYATMPLFHLHTFLFLSVLLACWFFFGTRRARWHWLRVAGFALIPASTLVLWLTDFLGGGPGMLGFQPGWMQGSKPFFAYWFTNFGIFLPLLAWLCYAVGAEKFRWPELTNRERSVARHFVLPAAGVFLACLFFRFAYWEWDNTKLMAWSYLAVLPFLWEIVFRPLATVVRVPLLIVLFHSGFLALIGGLTPPGNGYRVADRKENDAAAAAVANIPIDARFASAATHGDYNHPLVFLGRKLAMGYPGHFSGHGLPLGPTETDLETLMMGKPEWREAATRLHADFLYWGVRERAAYPDSTRSWMEGASLVSKGAWGELYRLPNARDGND